MTVQGCRHGTGAVVLRGTNTTTGKNVTFLLALAESPMGSGRYSVQLPPLWPVHGDVSISYYIYCPEAIAPTAGLAAGGTVVTLKGSGFTGATGVEFGTTPAATFKVLSDSLIEAVAPPGAGTVTVFVSTPRGWSVAALSAGTRISPSARSRPPMGRRRGRPNRHQGARPGPGQHAMGRGAAGHQPQSDLGRRNNGPYPAGVRGRASYDRPDHLPCPRRGGPKWPQADPFLPLRRRERAGPGRRDQRTPDRRRRTRPSPWKQPNTGRMAEPRRTSP